MKRCRVFLMLMIVCLLANTPVAFAYPDAASHWKDIDLVLFGSSQTLQGKPEKYRNAVHAIRYASQICIDQFGIDSGKAQLKRLNELNIPGIPTDISEIALFPEHNDHRIYTHLGWDHDYSVFDTARNVDWSSGRWPERKALLTDTVEHYFNFNGMPGLIDPLLGANEKCDAFAQLIYYTHILGDQIYYSCTTFEKGSHEVMRLGGTRQEAIIPELIELLPILFPEQDYSMLKKELEEINNEVDRLLNNPNSLKTEEGFAAYHQCTLDVRQALSDHIPSLLREEDFFRNVFYK